MISPLKLKKLYEKGENISAVLREEFNVTGNTPEIIEISYDIQTGSYIDAMIGDHAIQEKKEYTDLITSVILSLCKPESVLEAGIGEGTTLAGVLNSLGEGVRSYGFDLSWSRAAYARKWLHKQGLTNTSLCTGDLCNIPFLDNSVDVVFTSHAIEPNGGKEAEILRELYRITRKYLILLEPGYEFASETVKRRMDSHGYCKNLKETSQALGYQVERHELFEWNPHPQNPTSLTVISKNSNTQSPVNVFACPKLKTPLETIDNTLYSPEAMTAYPILGGIPCLRIENGIFASKYSEIMENPGFEE